MKKVIRKNGGFTLIEIIVVIVIIAILAGMLIPSMISWIDKSKEKTTISAGDTIRQAISAQVLDMYSKGKEVDGDQTTTAYDGEFWTEIRSLTDSKAQGSDSSKDEYVTFKISKGNVTEMTYTNKGLTASYDGSKWDCTKN